MRCYNCNSEWRTDLNNKTVCCPFCGVSLTQVLDGNDATIDQLMKKIFEQFGSDIALDKNKFLSVLKDYAPNLKKDIRIISIALDENIAKYFINCSIEDRQTNVLRAKKTLNAIMSDSAIDLVISSFTLALNWETVDSYIDHSDPNAVQQNIDNNKLQKTEPSLVTQPMISPNNVTKSIDPLQQLNMETQNDYLFNHIKTYPGLTVTPENEFKYRIQQERPWNRLGLGKYNQISVIDLNNSLEIVRITEYIGKRDVVVIPNRVAYKRVKSIENSAFKNAKTVKKIYIPYSMVCIAPETFEECYYLEEIIIPDSVTSIGNRAFLDCRKLKNIIIPNSVKSIGASAFVRCKSLDTIILPNSLVSIGDWAFGECSKLKKISIPNSVTNIGREAFGYGIGKTLIVSKNSYAQQYAKENHIKYIIKP